MEGNSELQPCTPAGVTDRGRDVLSRGAWKSMAGKERKQSRLKSGVIRDL